MKNDPKSANGIFVGPIMVRACLHCGVTAPLHDFVRSSTSPQGRGNRCKQCDASRVKANYAKAPDGTKQRVKSYYFGKQQSVLARQAVYKRSPAGKACSAREYLAHKPARKHQQAVWRAGAASAAWSDVERILKVYEMADAMTLETGVLHVVDHVYPLKSKLVSGLHTHDNLQILTGIANTRKGSKLPGDRQAELWTVSAKQVFGGVPA